MSDLRVDDPSVKQWHRVCGRLREEVGDAAYQSWVKPMTLSGIADGQVRLAVPTRFLRDWVNTHYAERIRTLWAGENPDVRAVKVEVAKAAQPRAALARPTSRSGLSAQIADERLVPTATQPGAKKPAVKKAPIRAKALTATVAPVAVLPVEASTGKAPVKAKARKVAPVSQPKAITLPAAPAPKAPRARKAMPETVIPESAPVAETPKPKAALKKKAAADDMCPVAPPRAASARTTKATPAKAVSAKATLTKPAPAKAAPAKAVSGKAAPAKAAPVKATPAKATSVKAALPKPATPQRRAAAKAPIPLEDDFDYAEAGFAAPDFDDMPPSSVRAAPAPALSMLPAGGVTATVVSDAVDDGLSAPLDPRYTFENFVTGKPNEFAYAAAQRVADSDRVAFNPLFLYGGVGLGKTHLMHAIAWAIRERHPGRRVVYLSAEKFMYSFVKALRYKTTMDFKEQFRSVDVLMIDDVQFISGKDSTQEEFFHTFNALVDQGRQIVISADKSPADLEDIGDRLRSRLASGLVADIHPTTYELRLGILAAKAEQMETEVPTKVLEFLAHKISSNVRELEGALTRLIAHAQLVGRELSLETAQDVLRDVLRANDRRITIEDIQKKVAEHFQIRLSDMSSARRSRSVARPRQVAMYLAKQLTSRSLPEIGRKFGGRDHTTVMHAVKKVDELMISDDAFAEDIDLLRRMLEV